MLIKIDDNKYTIETFIDLNALMSWRKALKETIIEVE